MKQTIIDIFEESVKQYGKKTFLLEKKTDRFLPTTYEEVQQQVYTLGAGLLQMGVEKNDAIALLSEGRNAWITSELAMFYAGAMNVPLSIKLEEANDLLFRLIHADVKHIIVSKNQLKKIRNIKEQLPLVKQIIILDDLDVYEEDEIGFTEWNERGKQWLEEHSLSELTDIGHSLQNDDIATITYTSGTTADPKGVMLTHRNYTANVDQSLTCMDFGKDWRTLIILPLDHCFAHVVGFYIFMRRGGAVATVQV